ncbi:cyclin-dependent kinase inhibitor 7 isoform X2 [Lactuca sativa]|uniref:Cyclin-dependent kinase inhibitor domain-containing protein n=1 Tax=Lactuca sativa TaxID=4236 RepID=A0A9R1VZ41_LACSA|nr:cyclin-dependent kinase inhibitor 7 isoform X2 [Lactuca sativa]KAJ0216712.1 hypothetical protein LSAT_V11C300135650 [Lactuca sativa]
MRTKASVVAEKRRKVGNGEPKSPFSQITTEKETETGTSAGDHNVVSCFSVNGSTEELEFADLKDEFETIASCNLDTRASKPSTESKPPEMLKSKPSSTTTNCRRRTVPTAELEEFFTAAEKDLHKRFKDKYNFDIVNETPSEGRFEWVQLKP